MSNKVEKNTLVGEAVMMGPGVVQILQSNGMGCLGCPSARFESLEDACMVHGMNADKLVSEINEFLAQQEA